MTGAICFCGAFVAAGAAEGAITDNATVPAHIAFMGRATDGTAVRITEQLTDLALSSDSPVDQGVAAKPGDAFLSFYAPGGTSDSTRPAFDGISGVANSDVHLVLADHAVVAAEQPGSDPGSLLLGTYAFQIPSATKAATLEVGPGSYDAVEYPNGSASGGTLTTITFQPAKTLLVIPAPVRTVPAKRTSPTTTVPAPATKPRSSVVNPRVRRTIGSGIGFATPLALGSGSGVVLVVLLVPIWRRRSFRRADAEGRVIIDSPPLPLGPRLERAIDATSKDRELIRPEPNGVPLASGRISLEVKVLGTVEIEGLLRPIELGPVRELLVFLALHPGRSFTSGELRSAIWVEGRDEPKPETLRNYLTYLRRSLPPDTITRDGYRYSLTEPIASDWSRFCSLVVEEERADRLTEALNLVRGPPFDGPSSGRVAPYSWAGELSHQIEAAVEKAAHELVTISFETGDLLMADTGVGQALRCVPASFVARGDHLGLGAALGGRSEVNRRMAAARVALGDDVSLLEPLAHTLGWERI